MRALLRAQGSGCSQRSSEAWAETTISARLQPELGAQERTGSVPSPSMPSRPAPPGTWRSCLWADVGRQLGSLPGMDREQHLPQAPRGPRGFRPSTLGLRLGGHRGHSTHTHVPPPTGSTLPPAHGSGGRGQGLLADGQSEHGAHWQVGVWWGWCEMCFLSDPHVSCMCLACGTHLLPSALSLNPHPGPGGAGSPGVTCPPVSTQRFWQGPG